MNPLPNDVVELQRELRLCVNLILQRAGYIEGDTPHEIVQRFCEMYGHEYRLAHPRMIIADGSPMPSGPDGGFYCFRHKKMANLKEPCPVCETEKELGRELV